MWGTQDLPVFVAAGLLLNMTPGADTLYIVGRSAGLGPRAGAAAALGVGCGCVLHVLAAAVGVSALLAASSWALGLVKLLGAAYLLCLGLGTLWATRPGRPVEASGAPGNAAAAAPQAAPALRQVWLGGFLTNALNPKVALFFLAFLPQFLAPGQASPTAGLLFLGAVFTCNSTLWNLLVAWLAHRAARRLAALPALGLWLRRLCGALFVLLAARLLAPQD